MFVPLILTLLIALGDQVEIEEYPKLAIVSFQDLSQSDKYSDQQIKDHQSLADILMGSLVNALQIDFDLMERQHLSDVLKEHALAQKGVLSKSDVKKLGRLTGVRYVLTGTITTLESKKRQFTGYNLESKFSANVEHQMIVNYRLIETGSSKIIRAGQSVVRVDSRELRKRRYQESAYKPVLCEKIGAEILGQLLAAFRELRDRRPQ